MGLKKTFKGKKTILKNLDSLVPKKLNLNNFKINPIEIIMQNYLVQFLATTYYLYASYRKKENSRRAARLYR